MDRRLLYQSRLNRWVSNFAHILFACWRCIPGYSLLSPFPVQGPIQPVSTLPGPIAWYRSLEQSVRDIIWSFVVLYRLPSTDHNPGIHNETAWMNDRAAVEDPGRTRDRCSPLQVDFMAASSIKLVSHFNISPSMVAKRCPGRTRRYLGWSIY